MRAGAGRLRRASASCHFVKTRLVILSKEVGFGIAPIDPRIEAMLALTATDFEKRANALIAQSIPPIELKLVQS